jgi:AcrR family transcriptional regulator
MKESSISRKTDRRTIYTRNVIKDSLLELLGEYPFDKITVSSVCKRAEITRATFYLHYDNLTSVLDDILNDALLIANQDSDNLIADMLQMLNLIATNPNISSLQEHEMLLPACQRVADSPKYRVVFQDETLSNYIIKKMYMAEKDHMTPLLMKNCGLTKKEADKIFIMLLYGVFAVNKSLNWEKNNEWYHLQGLLLKFILGGFEQLAK